MTCVDASVAAKWVFVEEDWTQARALLRAALEHQELLVAPPLLLSEVASIFRQRMRQGYLDLEDARSLLGHFLALPIAVLEPETLYDRALVLATEYDFPAVYDAVYVALAELVGATLWTADRRLLRVWNDRLQFVRAIAGWHSMRDI
jgi:predicted nucleic acid-binding protein